MEEKHFFFDVLDLNPFLVFLPPNLERASKEIWIYLQLSVISFNALTLHYSRL